MAFKRTNHESDYFIDINKFNFQKEKLSSYVIPMEFAHRPDLISYELYSDVSYQNMLSYINKIDDSPEGYYSGRVIKFLRRDFLGEV